MTRFQMVILITALASIGRATNRGPDAGGYTATDAAVYSFVDISSTGASVLAGVDDGVAPLTVPFSFQFYGNAYTMVCASANGALYFITGVGACTAINDFANADLTVSSPAANLPALFPFWSDLTFQVAGGGAVYYQTVGSPGNRRFVVQWTNAYPAGSSSPVTFQAILFEGSTQVLFQYQTVTLESGNAAGNGGLATVGIANSGGLASGQQIEWSFDAPVLTNSLALSFSHAAITSCAGNITAKVTLARGGFAFNAGTQRFVQSVTVTNSSGAPIAAPIYLALDGLTANASLANATGVTACPISGSPYITVLASGTLTAGQAVTLQLQFTNPTKGGIAYTPRVLSGAGTP